MTGTGSDCYTPVGLL